MYIYIYSESYTYSQLRAQGQNIVKQESERSAYFTVAVNDEEGELGAETFVCQYITSLYNDERSHSNHIFFHVPFAQALNNIVPKPYIIWFRFTRSPFRPENIIYPD